ncbi:putative ankyrin repeat protein L25 [Zancudomyces culisetae]|uniref:Putative ankyrin repeat protein L25 n=1 Tax=Zancudomyces culisetae TaxID=1213189 RepID=A0A1R1PHU2_ZANCU|nr:putative ankyrin repeat protein L25 [Zancudomyces culisetae]|eukprot:OMH80489.1 putative ankyrin repeat protein L25 [Zancudomyces culisetae]
MAYRTNSVDLIRLLLNNSDKLKGDLDENALKTAIKNNDYKLAKDIINKYPNTASIYCLEEAVRAGDVRTSRLLIEAGVDLFSPEFEGINISIESRDLDMLKLLLENGASVELIDQCATEKLCSIKNHEIAERLLELFGKNEGKLQAYDKTTIGMKPRFDKTMLCLIKVCQSHDQYNPDNNVEFNEFNEHLDLYEKVMVVVNSKRKDISDVFHSYYTSFCFSSLKSKISGACYDKLVDIVEYIVENGLQTTFSDTEHKEAGGFSYGEGLGMLNNRHYEMVKLELVDRNFEMLKLLVEYGMNVNSHDSLILRTAYKGGDINWINYFISKGIRLEGGSDGFDEAIRSNNIEVLEHWVRNGGVIPKNPEYECINMACLLGNFDMVKLLVESGVDLSDPERNGVRIACRLGLRRTLKYLLDNNAVVDGVPHYQVEDGRVKKSKTEIMVEMCFQLHILYPAFFIVFDHSPFPLSFAITWLI